MNDGTAGAVLKALERYDLKHDAETQWRCNSPFRAGSNSHGFTVTIDDDEHGAFLDHVSGETGSLYELAKRLGVSLPERGQAVETKRPYKDMAEYAAAHGLTVEDMQAAHCEQVVQDGRPAIRIPTATGPRFRFLDGGQPFKTPQGSLNSWYGFKHGLDMAKEKGALVYTNGLTSVIAAQKRGIPAVTMANSGERRLPVAMLTELQSKWQGELWIALDCDDTGRRASQEIARQWPGAKVLDLRLTERGDLADFCMLHGDQSWPEMAERAKAPVIVDTTPRVEGSGSEALANALSALAKAKREGVPDIDTMLDKVEQITREMRKERPRALSLSIMDIVGANEDALMAAKANPMLVRGLRCGLRDLDETLGGFVGGRVYVLLAATSMGKTTLSAQFVSEWSHQGRGLVVPTESSPFTFVNKMAATVARVSTTSMETGFIEDTETDRVIEAFDAFSQRRTHFLTAGATTPGMIREEIQRAEDDGQPFKWVVVDSLSKLAVPGTAKLYDTTSAAIDELQNIAIDTGVMVWATAQIGRAVKDRAVKFPQINDAKGSGDVEEDADVVMSLYRHDYYVMRGEAAPQSEFPPGTAMLRILKHRHRDIGEGSSSVQLAWLSGMAFGLAERRAA